MRKYIIGDIMGAIFNIMKKTMTLIVVLIMMLTCISCGKKDTAFEETSKAVLTVEETTKETEMQTETQTEIQTEETTEQDTETQTKTEESSSVSDEVSVAETEEETAMQEQTYTQPYVPTVTGSGRIVAIDAGHQLHGNSEQEPIGPGASETKAKVAQGTTGVSTGVPEYELTLNVSLKLKDELVARGYQVVMIRESNDVNLSNKERADIAGQSGAQIFVRIHANGSSNQTVNGALTLSPSQSNPYVSYLYDNSYSLSQSIVNNLCAATGAANKGVTLSDTMSGINWCTIPVSIVEMGFMSNPYEDELMEDESYQYNMASGIANGIDEYFASH